MLKVSDIMTPGVFTVSEDTAASEAAWGLTWRRMGGAPVADREGRLVGMLSKTDLIDPQPRQWIQGEATAGDLMGGEDLQTVYADDPAMVAVRSMARHNVHRLVVLNQEGEPVGMVTAFDVVATLARGGRFEEEDPAQTASDREARVNP
jgi:CBS-domain-containing membrane protein